MKTNPNMCILSLKFKVHVYVHVFKIQSYQPRMTRNAVESQIFDLFTKSSSGHKMTMI